MVRLVRCQLLLLEPREESVLDLASVLTGTPELVPSIQWIARAAHQDGERPISMAAMLALGSISSSLPCEQSALEARHGTAVVNELLGAGLLLKEQVTLSPGESEPASRIEDWHPLAAVAHRHLRWKGVDSEAATGSLQESGGSLLEYLGPPPAVVRERGLASKRMPLPRCSTPSALESLVEKRATGRNFCNRRPLALESFATLLERTYGSRALSHTSGVPVMKRATASAGGLHAIEAFLLVQNVEGLGPGLYHYHPIEHSLQPLKELDAAAARELASRFVARQAWFETAAVQVIMVARFARNHWKYRRHAKTHRALILDAGHLSHHQYLVATELGLAAFITAAINEGDIEEAFELDPMKEGVVAVTGFGYRGEHMEVLEFDPCRRVWPEWQAE